MQVRVDGKRNITLDFEAPKKFKLLQDGKEIPYLRTGKNSFRLSRNVDGVLDLEEIKEQPKIVKPMQLQAQQMALVNPNDVLMINQAAQQLEVEQNILGETQKRVEQTQAYLDVQQQRINETILSVQGLETNNAERISATENGLFNLAGNLATTEQNFIDSIGIVNNGLQEHKNAENPHGITKKTIGLDKVDNTSDMDKPISKAVQIALDEKADKDEIQAIREELGEYQEKNDRFTNALSNYTGGVGGNELPSGGSQGQVLAKRSDQSGDVEWIDASVDVDDELSLTSENPVQNKIITSALNSKASEDDLTNHINDKDNPHEVTKAQVGLGNVDNTADIDKPIIIKSETIPTADVTTHKKIYQYSGTTNSIYTHGYIYECLYLNGSYVWQRIDVQPNTAMWGMIGGNLNDQTDLNNSLTGLQSQIDDLSGRGRFLSLWNCATGLAATNPPESPYTYKDGDYFIVGTVSTATPAVNYKPNGSSYTTGTASTTVETAEVKVDDTYIYDGTNWKLQSNTQKTVTFASLAGQPTDNANLSTALNTKVDKTSTASRLYGTDSTGAQALYLAGDNIELASDGKINVTGVQQQLFEMPEATADLLGSIVQYMGETNATYTHGVMYQCVPVYGDYTATYVSSTISNVVVDTATFDASNEYVPGTLTYTFTCTNGGLRQQWRLPSGMSTRFLGGYGISYTGRAAANDTITITKGIVGYAWEAYAGVSSGNDKIKVVGEKIYGVNVVGQYNINTCPDATEDNAGMIIQWKSTLLDIRTPGWFYQCQEDTRMRDYRLSANPDKYSQLYISDLMTLEDYMSMQMDDITFEYKAGGWVEQDSMSMLGREDLTSIGITYVLADGQSLEIGDTITINIVKSYIWRNIQVQPNDFIVDFLPEANMENWTKVVFLAGSDMLSPIEGYPYGKWYRCVERYNETTEEWYYEWEMLPGQDGLQQLSELPTDNTGIVSDGQCICYVGEDNVEYENDFETIYLRKGHIYRAVVTDADDENLLHINYYETYTSQFGVMPYPNAEYEGVITQYTGEDGDYTNGHFYKCVPTGEMTGPLSKQKHDGDWEVSINPSVLETQVSDPTEPMKFTFQSQAEGAQWLIEQGSVYTTIDLADYGITITGEVPYGSRLYVKYIEPQEEYEWEQVDVQPSSGGASTDVQINGISITSNDVANIVTESAYNATTNKIATMADVSTPTYSSADKTIIFS